MGGLDDLIGGLQKAQTGGGGTGIDDLLGGLLGGGGGQGGGGLADALGGLVGGSGSGGGGIGDVLGGVLGGSKGPGSAGGAGGLGALLTKLGPVLAMLLASGGLSKILGGMKASGLSAQADSWVGTGANEPVSADDVRRALGDHEIDQVAGRLGVAPEEASAMLASVLPELVNTVTPEGEVPSDDDLDRLAGVLEGFGR